MGGVIAIVVVVVLFMAALPVLVGLQGWLRDRARRRTIEAFREQNAGVLLVNTKRWPTADSTVAPALVASSTVRCLDSTRFSLGSLRQIVGGEMKMFGGNMNLARDEAIERLRDEARGQGFDCVLNVRFETSQVAATAFEIVAYGTGIRRAAQG